MCCGAASGDSLHTALLLGPKSVFRIRARRLKAATLIYGVIFYPMMMMHCVLCLCVLGAFILIYTCVNPFICPLLMTAELNEVYSLKIAF